MTWARVLRRTVTQLSDEFYEIAVELSARPMCAGYAGPTTPSGYYPPLGSATSAADGYITYQRPGLAYNEEPTPFFAGAWHFPIFQYADAGAHNGAWADAGGEPNSVRCIVVGSGTITVYTRNYGESGGRKVSAYLQHDVVGVGDVTDASQLNLAPGSTITFEVDASAVCVHWVHLDLLGTGAVGFDGFNWVNRS